MGRAASPRFASVVTGLTLFSSLFAFVSEAGATAADPRSAPGLTGNVGLNYDIGRIGNGEMELPERTMQSLSVSALPGYRFGKLLLGLDLEYGIQRQMTSLENAGGTNLRGVAYGVGFGANYLLMPNLAIQGAIHFVGRHDFDQDTDSGVDDHMSRPLGLRLEGQYFFSESLPLSLDAGVKYVRYQEITVGARDITSATTQWAVGIGMTYHFGAADVFRSRAASAGLTTPVEPVVAAPVVGAVEAPKSAQLNAETSVQELAKVVDVKQTDRGAMVSLGGDVSFAPYSAELSAGAKDLLAKAAKTLSTNASLVIRVEGYTDTSGRRDKNYEISKARAENVKAFLIESGVEASRISSQGFGPEKPIADNKTKEGRATNRRVEIYISEK